MSESELRKAIEFIPDRLYYVAVKSRPRDTVDKHFFSTDEALVYWNFFLDFGPLNLGQLYRFSQLLSHKLNDKSLARKRIYYYSGSHAHRRTNSAYLISAFAMLFLDRSPEEAWRPFEGYTPSFPPFHDASPCVCTYNLTILDCLRGTRKARDCGFFNFDRFNVDEYEHFEKVENGDLNWLVEGKFIAFAGPHEHRSSSPEGYYTLCPDDYIPYFQKMNVTLVVRLNKKYYNENRFKRAGIDHLDLYYLDGSTPPDHLLQKFIKACEDTPGAVAVHCKAGLGRTGTCIGAYIMKHFGFTAAETTGWIRVCRPGSIIGPQQHYMEEIQHKMWRDGEEFRRKYGPHRHIRERGESRRRPGSSDRDSVRAAEDMLNSLQLSDRSAGGGSTRQPIAARSSSGSARERERERERLYMKSMSSPVGRVAADLRDGGSPGGSVSSATSQGDTLLQARDSRRGVKPAGSTSLGRSYTGRSTGGSSGGGAATPPRHRTTPSGSSVDRYSRTTASRSTSSRLAAAGSLASTSPARSTGSSGSGSSANSAALRAYNLRHRS